VFPSRFEGFGLPVLEAMKCGTPVICARSTALPEVAGDAVRYFEPSDWEDLALSMAEMVQPDGPRQAAIARSYQRVAAFSWERCARETLAVFEKIAG
jgi:glycosyltransferase involved in cell wall biosynthesis